MWLPIFSRLPGRGRQTRPGCPDRPQGLVRRWTAVGSVAARNAEIREVRVWEVEPVDTHTRRKLEQIILQFGQVEIGEGRNHVFQELGAGFGRGFEFGLIETLSSLEHAAQVDVAIGVHGGVGYLDTFVPKALRQAEKGDFGIDLSGNGGLIPCRGRGRDIVERGDIT
jgi:hypothetical protein